MPLDLPPGSVCFVDTNVLFYHFVTSHDCSTACTGFVERIVVGEIIGHVAVPIIADLIHKVMLAEAAQRLGLTRATISAQTRQIGDTLARLTAYRQLPEKLKAMPLRYLDLESAILEDAVQVSAASGLLTNDAIIVALMRRHGIQHIATNDDDFDSVSGITVWKPR